METYRYRGHSMSDPAKYRTKEEVDSYKEHNDPLLHLQAAILKAGLAKDAEFEEIETRVSTVVKASAEFAQTSPEPDASELYTDVLIEA
jgi:pyruvate dehydrogenase E1 component alpha subunit